MHASTAKYQTQITGNPQAQEQLKKQSSLKTYKMTGVFFFQSQISPHMQSNAFSTKDIDALSLNNILISLSNQLVFHISVLANHFSPHLFLFNFGMQISYNRIY